MLEPIIISNCHRIAKGLAPFKSGNLRENAIKITKRNSKGFTINYSYVNAYYIKYVEEGTHDIQGNVVIKPRNFIRKTHKLVAEYLNSYYNGGKMKHKKDIKTALRDCDLHLYQNNRDYRDVVHMKSYEKIYERFNKER